MAKSFMLKLGSFLFLTVAIFGGEKNASAENTELKIQLPEITLDDVFLQTQLRAQEESLGGLDPILWSLGAKTQFVSWVDAQVTVGASQLLYRPNWSVRPAESVAVVDLLITMHSLLGDIYAGQTLVPWGLQGQTKESELWLPRDLLYENGAFPLRDLGIGLHTEVNGLYMNVMAHNGEGAELSNSDNRMFLTAQWGMKVAGNTNFGVSATTGRVASPNIIPLANGVPQEEKLKGGNAFFGFNIFGLGLQAEATYLETVTDVLTSDIFAFHIDAEHPISDHLNLLGRYEQYNPNTRATSNIQTRAYAGGEYHSLNNCSRLFLLAISNNQSQQNIPSNEVLLLWRITPPSND